MAYLLAIKKKREELGKEARWLPENLMEAINDLIDVKTEYVVYLYKSISSKPDIIEVSSMSEVEEKIVSYYMYEVFQKETFVYKTKTKTSTFLIKRCIV